MVPVSLETGSVVAGILNPSSDTEIHLEIMDPIGRILLHQEFPPYGLTHKAYDLSNRSPGIYFLRIYDESSQIIKKLMIQ